MPGKSRRIRGKHSPQGKDKKNRQRFSATVTQQTAVAQTNESVHHPKASASSASRLSSMTKPLVTHYPYIVAELLSIGMLAGVMLLILVVLTLVLS